MMGDSTWSGDVRRTLPLMAAGGTLAVLVWAMAYQSATWPTAGAAALAQLWPYWVASAAVWAALTWWAIAAWRQPTRVPTTLPTSFGHAAAMLLLVAVLVRLMTAATTSPVLSDDLWRYLLDGQTLASGDNPYRLSPAQRAELPPTDADDLTGHARTLELIQRVNHPHLVTIYQPTSQWSFALLHRLGAWTSNPFRLGFAVVDVAIVGLLLIGLRMAGASPWWAALYAWHPLAITETAGSGHQDVLGILPLMGALVVTERLVDVRGRGHAGQAFAMAAAVGGLFALAVAVKPVVAPLALPMGWAMARGVPPVRAATSLGAAGVVGCLVLAALYGPFVMMPGGLSGMIETGRTFMADWAFNGSIHPMLSAWLGDEAADWIGGGLLLGVLVLTMVLRLDAIEAAITYLLAALLLSTTVHPWYLLWVLALAPLRPGFALSPVVWVWSLTISWSYGAHLTPDYSVSFAVAVIEYLPVYAVLGWMLVSRMMNRTSATGG